MNSSANDDFFLVVSLGGFVAEVDYNGVN